MSLVIGLVKLATVKVEVCLLVARSNLSPTCLDVFHNTCDMSKGLSGIVLIPLTFAVATSPPWSSIFIMELVDHI
jgi:hypothetical protein